MDLQSAIQETHKDLFGEEIMISSSNSEHEPADVVWSSSSSEEEGEEINQNKFDVVVNEDYLEEGPQPNMQFECQESLVAAYQAHAKHKGFSTAIRRRRGKYLMIVCHRARKIKVVKFTQRIECPARINAIQNDNGSWRVSSVNSNHNHELDPKNSCFMAAHRSMSVNVMRQLDANDIAGLKPCKNIRVLEVQAGGPHNLGVLEKDCRNFIQKRRRLRLGKGDAEAIQQLFLRLQKSDRNFFYLMDIDDNCRLRNVMWIHPRSVTAYEEFHEVVSFDTTYLVNKYNMPFATVVGINHHNQSILLGCALLSREDNDSFKWFWSNWLAAMGGLQPTAILTDQADSIRNALREVMPDTIHRLCIWHILSKTAKKFKDVVDHKQAVIEFNELIYESLTICEFELKWKDFAVKYDLQENRWLEDLWNERQSWVPVYLKHIFWAGCKSTQRSESMHSFFDGYIHSKSTLKQFVEQYEIAVNHKIRKEMRADYDSKTRVVKCCSVFKWEEQFQRVYTNAIFELFQEEIKGIWCCNIRNDPVVDEGVETFEVHDSGMMSKYHKQFTFTVKYRPTWEIIDCDCKLFESKGILCRHILKVISTIKSVDYLVNERYIMRRWRKDVYRRHSSIFFAGAYPHMTKEYKMFQEAEKVFQKCTDKSYEDVFKMEIIKDVLNELCEYLDTVEHREVVIVDDDEDMDVDNPNPILDPEFIIRRGRPRKNRLKPIEEIIRLRAKKGKTKAKDDTNTNKGRTKAKGKDSTKTKKVTAKSKDK